MKKLLVVVDMQNDFINGALGTSEAVAIVPNVVKKINEWDGDVVFTMDTHYENYKETNEGKHLPVPHCINNTDGWDINEDVNVALKNNSCYTPYLKGTFGSPRLANDISGMNYDYVELIGLCTDICVVSNALLIKAHCPEIDIAVDASCCAGVTPESHKAALITMKMCQIDVIGE